MLLTPSVAPSLDHGLDLLVVVNLHLDRGQELRMQRAVCCELSPIESRNSHVLMLVLQVPPHSLKEGHLMLL